EIIALAKAKSPSGAPQVGVLPNSPAKPCGCTRGGCTVKFGTGCNCLRQGMLCRNECNCGIDRCLSHVSLEDANPLPSSRTPPLSPLSPLQPGASPAIRQKYSGQRVMTCLDAFEEVFAESETQLLEM